MVYIMNRMTAFSLMELIVVIAIVAIIAGAGYPNYLRLKREAKRTDAQAAVINTDAIVRRYLAENNKANITNDDLALTQFAAYSIASGTPKLSNGHLYRLTIVPDSTSYAINATATVDGGLNDCTTSGNENLAQCADIECRVISIYNGLKQSTNSTGQTADEDATKCW